MVKLADAVEVITCAAAPLETLYLCCMDMEGLSPELKAGIRDAVSKIRLFCYKLENDKKDNTLLCANISKMWEDGLDIKS